MEYPKREVLESALYEDLKKVLVSRYHGMFERAKKDEGEFLIQKLYLEPQDGCVPEEFIGEELLYAVKSKYYEIFSVVRDKIQSDYLKESRTILIFIDPCYEDSTHVLVVFEGVLLIRHDSKPWHFNWLTPLDLKKEMADWYYEMRDRLNQYFLEGIHHKKEK